MATPGAKISTQLPKLDQDARASSDPVAATVIAVGVRAGDASHALAPLLPAATA